MKSVGRWTNVLLLVPLLGLWFQKAHAQINCAMAPTPALRIVCEQLHRWDTNARAAPPKPSGGLPPGIDVNLMGLDLPTVAANIYQCMDLGCVCNYLRGNGQGNSCTLPNGQPLRKSLRKEYRMLTDDERQRYHAAVRQIKSNGEYNSIAKIHSDFATAGGAHSGPAFLPWHREFIKRYELALRSVDPTVNLPYWDSVLDNNLPRPQDSIMWTPDFVGGHDASGNVVSGSFAPWQTLAGRANIRRAVGAQGTLFRESEIASVMRQTQVENVLAFTAPQQGCAIRADWNWLEYTHGNVHIYVGGDMLDQSTSGNDPIFFMHHAFVDLIWEMWRQQRQTRAQREQDYPLDQQLCSSPNHFGARPMQPFVPWTNHDGLSNKYTDNMYEYSARPTCTAANPSCGGSKYLFCMRTGGAPRCAAKVKVGGSCQGLSEADKPCYNGVCQANRCVASRVTTPAPLTTPKPPLVTFAPPSATQETCFNENECCSIWQTQGECQKNPSYMNAWCKASCGACRPKYSMAVECSNRHQNCIKWSRSGECSKNKLWMSENCRQACGKCAPTRAQVCGGGRAGGGGVRPTTPRPAAQQPTWAAKCNSPGCFNEHMCCTVWSMEGQCRTNATWMACNCKVSCGQCLPRDYNYGTCTDYHTQCTQWARSGECDKNPWMRENCRFSCQTCLSGFELRGICRGGGQIPRRGGGGGRPRGGGWGGSPPPDSPPMRFGVDGLDLPGFSIRWGRQIHDIAPM